MKQKTNLKILIALVIMLLALFIFNSNIVNAQLISESDIANIDNLKVYNNLVYTIENEEIEIVGYTDENIKEVIIPDTINEYKVTKIGWDAFSECKTLTSIKIPNSVVEIKSYAFADCTNLTKVEIPNSVISIEPGVFVGCTSLSNITIPEYVTKILNETFYGCTSLKSIKISKSITDIAKDAFDKDILLIVEENSYAEQFAKDNNYNYKYITKDLNIENKVTNIKLDTDTTVVPSDTVLETKEIKEEKTLNVVKESLKEVSNKFITYDITLKNNNVAIQPNGKVKISIPVPENFDKTKIAVFRIENNGTKVEYNTKMEGNFATIETDHFSTYVLAENNIKDNSETNNTDNTNTQNKETTSKDEKDNTPKTGTIDIIGYVVSTIVLSGIGIVELKKNLK